MINNLRRGINSIPELMINSNSGIDCLKNPMKLELELKFPTKYLIHKLIYDLIF